MSGLVIGLIVIVAIIIIVAIVLKSKKKKGGELMKGGQSNPSQPSPGGPGNISGGDGQSQM